MTIQLSEQRLEPWRILQDHQSTQFSMTGKHGATSIFVGTMRDFNQGDGVTSMVLEHYPGMTEKILHDIVAQAELQWQVLDSLVVHRIGTVYPDEVLVVVAVWAAHRGDAFDASRYIMEQLKHRAPFWKKETLASGKQRWVEKNSAGYQTDYDD